MLLFYWRGGRIVKRQDRGQANLHTISIWYSVVALVLTLHISQPIINGSEVNSMMADLLYAQADRAKGYTGRNGDEVLADMDRIIYEVERVTIPKEQSTAPSSES